MIKIELLNKEKDNIYGKYDHEKEYAPFIARGEKLCTLGLKEYFYQIGDKIRVTVDQVPGFYMVQLDETLAPSLLYFTQKEWLFEIPLTDNLRKASVETAFKSVRHSLTVRKAYPFEISNYQNLSFNPHDQKKSSGVYPHISANVETRDESIFFVKNAIDGKLANLSHGSYPFASWGINQQPDAELTIDFGRTVEVDNLSFLFRCDFPHDSYWQSVQVIFSNGNRMTFDTEKYSEYQNFNFSLQQTSFIKLACLKKAQDDSPFPALVQIEVFGKNKSEQ
ncbi:hypothetical protein [Lactococcus lactis]|uniref:Carbohydrate-binding protein n=1 Tax=Lactococcus lactis subsp. lactis TaxID=1360 RepID=A0A2N5WFX2_LACLL|nr:hypothetical protein [Lactococcus lactis]PLW61136.1 hypothetical protein CYU10_002208 [Lactococcus lactis subsp. lactis]